MRRKNALIFICIFISVVFFTGCGTFRYSKKNVLKSSKDYSENTGFSTGSNEEDSEKDVAKKAGTDDGKSSEDGSEDKDKKEDGEQAENLEDDAIEARTEAEEPIDPPEAVHTMEQNLNNIMQCARYGTLINLEFKCGETNISEVEDKWGKADKSDYVADAKGTYSTYSSHNLVFGWNKGGQIFEIRSDFPSLSDTPYYMTVKILGEPDYSVDVNGERIIGYVANDKYKVLIVFNGTSINSKIDHYSVLYPAATANLMLGDPGREW